MGYETADVIDKAVVLARGLGTRMRRAAQDAVIDENQAVAADAGMKAMIPVGRPFLDYVLSALADAGFTDACLVIGPEHDTVRDYYTRQVTPTRIRVHFAIQELPLGTANAVAAAESFAARDQFLVINSDNYYPVSVFDAVRRLGHTGLAGFNRAALVRDGNVDDARVAKYAVLDVDAGGMLCGIIEKPDADTWSRVGPDALISMNCWRFGPVIFEAARRIERSPRGEFELADAVKYAMTRLGAAFRVVPVRAGVLDLSTRGDILSVASRLERVEVRL
ncbi:MAG TPA: sugar phosphate nucleotidyltransferase [Vicinamibacterales bacterium]|jgi:glucose-1-phosphate thymidylyltransferase